MPTYNQQQYTQPQGYSRPQSYNNQPRQYANYQQGYAMQSAPHHHHYLLLFAVLAAAIIASFLFFKYYDIYGTDVSNPEFDAEEFGEDAPPPLPEDDAAASGIRSSGSAPPALPE